MNVFTAMEEERRTDHRYYLEADKTARKYLTGATRVYLIFVLRRGVYNPSASVSGFPSQHPSNFYSHEMAPVKLSGAGRKEKRTGTACCACRGQKIKCRPRGHPPVQCEACLKKGIACKYMSVEDQRRSQSQAPTEFYAGNTNVLLSDTATFQGAQEPAGNTEVAPLDWSYPHLAMHFQVPTMSLNADNPSFSPPGGAAFPEAQAHTGDTSFVQPHALLSSNVVHPLMPSMPFGASHASGPSPDGIPFQEAQGVTGDSSFIPSGPSFFGISVQLPSPAYHVEARHCQQIDSASESSYPRDLDLRHGQGPPFESPQYYQQPGLSSYPSSSNVWPCPQSEFLMFGEPSFSPPGPSAWGHGNAA
ncbi:hypothetical protein LshimejAT787_0113030 [Lyophyllum shimeji]|uniref:Zn(2)-C6 fungal-type domain-containing protein n=1 Tax=Lyophyllum shimeji TaxID=47721 RepID=A0A9P3UHR9_LYOSH|nr:hypothetical protein LshimejAT787_0113030 [Lyophyllum shimeji]